MVKVHLSRKTQIFLAIGAAILILDVIMLRKSAIFVPVLAIALTIAWLPFWLGVFAENRRQKELESRFPDFVRNLTGAIKSGMPAAQAVIQVSDTDYGALMPHVKKLANQLEWSI